MELGRIMAAKYLSLYFLVITDWHNCNRTGVAGFAPGCSANKGAIATV